MIAGIPIPDREGPFEAGFWAALDRGELAHQHCADCGDWAFPPRWRCHCGGALEYRAVSGRATLWSWTQVHAPVLPAFAEYVPYVVGIAALEEAPALRMVGSLVLAKGDPINRVQPGDLAVGMPLEAQIVTLAEGLCWPVWRIDTQKNGQDG